MVAVIQIRGTSGSGKSTVMREVLSDLGGPIEVVWRPTRGKRKLPLYYLVNSLAILGHYESPCGGGDTIGSSREIYDLIRRLPAEVKTILVEGLLLSEDTKWTRQLVTDGYAVKVLFLTTNVERCIRQVKQRRREGGNDKPLNEHNTRNRVGVIERARVKLTEAGVYCRRASPEQAAEVVLRWLRRDDNAKGVEKDRLAGVEES